MNSAPIYRALDRNKPVRIYYRDLPHWRQDGATYFVTFRQADSIPRSVVRSWQRERAIWYAAHDLDRTMDREQFARMYAHVPERERRDFERREARRLFDAVDRGHGSCLLQYPANRELVANAMAFFNGSRYHLGDFVVLPNHVHVLLLPLPGFPLERILQSVKHWTSARMAHRVPGSKRFWQADSYDRIVRDQAELSRIRRYIRSNPEKTSVGNSSAYHAAAWLDAYCGANA